MRDCIEHTKLDLTKLAIGMKMKCRAGNAGAGNTDIFKTLTLNRLTFLLRTKTRDRHVSDIEAIE